jgi:HK97 family phage major capsid protein
VLATYEAAVDTHSGEQLPGLFGDAKDRIESQYFATGSGTNAPLGVIPALAAGSRVAPAATGTAFNGTGSIVDIYNLQAALPPRFRASSRRRGLGTLCNSTESRGRLRRWLFWANLTSNTPASPLGQPIYEGSDFPATRPTSAASERLALL